MKIPLGGAELFLADGRTDMTKLILVFRNFANAPKNHFIYLFTLNAVPLSLFDSPIPFYSFHYFALLLRLCP